MSECVYICISKVTYLNVLNFIIRNNICYKDLKIIDDKIYLVIEEDSLFLFKAEFESVIVIKRYGVNGIKDFLKKHYILLISVFISYLVIILLSNIIFEVDISTSNTLLKEKVLEYLKSKDIEKYKFIKSKDEINSIKKSILEDNKDFLEWIEIERVGTKYKVYLTERVIINDKTDDRKTNIVALKDGMIKYIVVNSGTKLKEVNEIVKKGEILISGDIIKDDKIVDQVNASGRVYAEVWYKVNTEVPYKHVVYEKTGKVINHIYLDIFGKKFTLIGKYETDKSMNEEEILIEKPYLLFKVIKETKELYDYKTVNLTLEEAYEEAIKRSDKSIIDKLNLDEYIIDKKVLKKEELSSKISIEVFYRVYENIALEEEIMNKQGE